MERTNTLEEVAYHEAGHAVLYVEFDEDFNYVLVEPSGSNAEKWEGVVHRTSSKQDNSDIRPDEPLSLGEPLVERRFKEIMAILAGLAVERILGGNWEVVGPELVGGYKDWSRSRELAWAVFGAQYPGDRVAHAYLNWKLLQTQALLNSPRLWARVEALARELVRRRRMSADEVRSLLAEVPPSISPCPPDDAGGGLPSR